jgi:hypothetical protein
LKSKNLKTLIALGLAVAFSLSVTVSSFAATATPAPKVTAKDYTGYLMDVHCAKTGVDDETGKVNIKKNPEKHTTSCLKIDMCMMEGLGIMIKQKDNTYKFYKFDKAGYKKADDKIMMMTKRKFGNKIAVKGTIKGNSIIISTIKETK